MILAFALFSLALTLPDGKDRPSWKKNRPSSGYTGSQAPEMSDYYMLYDVLRTESKSNSDAVPHWTRSSFHDLVNFDPTTGQGGPHGCMKDDPVRSMAQNAQLDTTIRQLNLLVHQKLPGIQFPFGDVISLAGKVAIEEALPCIRIKWRPGRPACGFEVEGGPSGGMTTFKQLTPFRKRYGLNATEFAILLAGTHGLKGAKLHTLPLGELPWVSSNSGLEYIKNSFNCLWYWFALMDRNIKRVPKDWQLETGGITHVYEAQSKIRLPVDMMFFPSKIASSVPISSRSVTRVDDEFERVEAYLKNIATSNSESEFNIEFAQVYEKMLEIGTDPKELSREFFEDLPVSHDESFQEEFKSKCPNGLEYPSS